MLSDPEFGQCHRMPAPCIVCIVCSAYSITLRSTMTIDIFLWPRIWPPNTNPPYPTILNYSPEVFFVIGSWRRRKTGTTATSRPCLTIHSDNVSGLSPIATDATNPHITNLLFMHQSWLSKNSFLFRFLTLFWFCPSLI